MPSRKPAPVPVEEAPTVPPPAEEATRPLTSGQLRAKAAAAKDEATSSNKKATRPALVKPVDRREMTVKRWSQGRADAVLAAFVSTQARGRTVKRTPGEWMKLYQDFLKQPRG